MRIFRPDNHLLWMGILVTVAVTLYVGSTYWLDDTLSSTSTPTLHKEVPPQRLSDSTDADTANTVAGQTKSEAIPLNTATATKPPHRVRFRQESDNVEKTLASAGHTTASARTSHEIPSHVFLDVAKQDFLKDPFVGRVVIELYTQDAPHTVRNFVELCRDKKYVNTPFHRVIKDFMVQGGDIVNQDGTGTYSIYGGEGATFQDEPFVHAHTQPGLLSMANSGPHTNGCQFFITTAPAPHLDGKHVVFGRVVEGLEHVHDLEREVTDPNDRPIRKCYIMNCGVAKQPSEATSPPPAWKTATQTVVTPPAAQALETYTSPPSRTPQPGIEGGIAGIRDGAQGGPEPVPFQL